VPLLPAEPGAELDKYFGSEAMHGLRHVAQAVHMHHVKTVSDYQPLLYSSALAGQHRAVDD